MRMKLRELMANSLPRTKNKSKKRTQSASSTPNNATPTENTVNGLSQGSDYDVTPNKSLVTDDFHYLTEGRVSCLEFNENFGVNFNVLNTRSKCGCYKHISPCITADSSPKESLRRIHISYGDPVFNTVPKTRTRIKTNPWIRSPVSTPSPSPDLSPSSSSSGSPKFPSAARKGSCSSGISSESLDDSKSSGTGSLAEEPHSIDILDKGSDLRKSFLSDTDNSVTANEHFEYPDVFDDTSIGRLSSSGYFGSQSTYDIDTTLSLAMEHKHSFQTQISFEYEEAFESQIEAEVDEEVFAGGEESQTVCGNPQLDLFLDESRDSINNTYESESDDSGMNMDDTSDDLGKSSTEESTDETICDETPYYEEDQEDEPKIEDTYQEERESYNGNICSMESDSSFDSAFDTRTCASDSSSRSASEIKLSLEQKVYKLKQEKLLVQEKIRQAQEEERIRQQEKIKFQKQLTLHRKQMLLRTLQDLKAKLEGQSQRLQTTYNSVLYMQRNSIKHRRSSSTEHFSD